jgi:hypothetical protein
MARARIGAGAVYLLENDRRLGNVHAAAPVFIRDERRQPSCFGQSLDEFLGVRRLLVHALPVVGAKTRAQFAHAAAVLLVQLVARIDLLHAASGYCAV